MTERITVKEAAERLFGLLANEHPLGHQPSKANRYMLKARTTTLEVMFEKNVGVPVNIWILKIHGDALGKIPIRSKFSHSADLRTKKGKNGLFDYGRHSALENMPELGEADLICFAPENLEQLGMLLDHLLEL